MCPVSIFYTADEQYYRYVEVEITVHIGPVASTCPVKLYMCPVFIFYTADGQYSMYVEIESTG